MKKDISEIYISKNLNECKELVKEYKKFLENYELHIQNNQIVIMLSKNLDGYIQIIPKEGIIDAVGINKKNQKLEKIAKSEFIAHKDYFGALIDKQEFRIYYQSRKELKI